MVVIDAKGAVVGRLGARVAKLLLAHQPVEIVNADKAVMLGTLVAAKEKYTSRRSQKNKRNPDESPHWPRSPRPHTTRCSCCPTCDRPARRWTAARCA